MKLHHALLFSATLIQSPLVFSQASTFLHTNDVRMRVFSNGFIGQGYSQQSPGFFVPADLGTTTLYGGGLWLSGTSSNDLPRTAAHLYNDDKDFFPGPLTVDGTASISSSTSLAYDRLWEINLEDVEYHYVYHTCLADPDCDMAVEFPGEYNPPASFLTWPAMGNVNADQATYLAPFRDRNEDGVYNANDGDYPCVPGDDAVFSIFNDRAQPHALTGTAGIGIEVHMTTFGWHTSTLALHQTVFVQYKLFNRGLETLTDFRIASFADLDIGCPEDDLIGTDVGRNMVYVYNGAAVDPFCLGTIGYGPQPPAFGMVVLKGPRMDANGTDDPISGALPAVNGYGFGDGIVDNERHGLGASMYFNREGSNGQTDPAFGNHFRGYLTNTWKDGNYLSYGGPGYPSIGLPVRYVFPGASDPTGAGTSGIPQPAWSEVTAGNPYGDRRALATMGPITLEPGAEHDLLIAYVFARATSGGSAASIAALQQRVDSVSNFINSIPDFSSDAAPCANSVLLGTSDRRMPNGRFSVHPIPANEQLNVQLKDNMASIRFLIHDAVGTLVMEYPGLGAIHCLNIGSLRPGLYTIRTEDGKHVARFVKE